MKVMKFNVNEFPKLCEEFNRDPKNTDWIEFLYELGYKFKWNHYATKKKYVEMTEQDFVWFVLRWS